MNHPVIRAVDGVECLSPTRTLIDREQMFSHFSSQQSGLQSGTRCPQQAVPPLLEMQQPCRRHGAMRQHPGTRAKQRVLVQCSGNKGDQPSAERASLGQNTFCQSRELSQFIQIIYLFVRMAFRVRSKLFLFFVRPFNLKWYVIADMF